MYNTDFLNSNTEMAITEYSVQIISMKVNVDLFWFLVAPTARKVPAYPSCYEHEHRWKH